MPGRLGNSSAKKLVDIMSKLKKNNNSEFENIILLIQDARDRAFRKVNEELVLLYYNVGKIVSQKVSAGVWGEGTVDELANYIAAKLPGLNGFNRRGLYRMKQFFETYSIEQFVSPLAAHLQSYFNRGTKANVPALPTQITKSKKTLKKVSALRTQSNDLELLHQQFVTTVLTQISWTNHRLILSKTKSTEEKFYYLLISINEKYSTREFERTMLSSPIVSALRTQLPQNIFKDPYVFEFLDLHDGHTEKDMEKALILNLQKFILEIGKGFTYMGSQYRLQVGNKDYYTDLLFYHRDLQCLVLFELKIQEFEPEFLGKLNFYLEALDRDVKRKHENPSVGVLLCKGKDTEVVEYAMARNSSPAMIADYETKLIPKAVLANKLHQLVEQLTKPAIE
jgi:predicted nuclease of restriction endonuclease-like (RecB) superfamily